MALTHDRQDGVDAATRARRTHTPDWHPILAAVEVEPGTWVMTADRGNRYAVIRLLRIGEENGYRAVTWAERSEDRRLIGYFRSLRAACFAAHRVFIAAHGAPGFAPKPWSR
jgi:hypothetical protein